MLTPEEAVRLYRAALSVSEIARRWGTYPKKVSRLLDLAGEPRRSRSDQQKLNLSAGGPHPTKGRSREPSERARIGRGVAADWAGKSEQELSRRKGNAAALWRGRPASVREAFVKAGLENTRRASLEGSALAKHLTDRLAGLGPVERSPRMRVAGRVVRPTAVLPTVPPTAVLVWGPSHYRPLFGPGKLARQQAADATAVTALAAAGYSVVIVAAERPRASAAYRDMMAERLLEVLPVPPGCSPLTVTEA